MDDDYIMSTSVMQYLDDIRTYIKDNHAINPTDDKVEISSTEQINDGQQIQEIIFDNEQGGNLAFEDVEHQENKVLNSFEQRVSLDDPPKYDSIQANFEPRDADAESITSPQDENKNDMEVEDNETFKSLYNAKKVSKGSESHEIDSKFRSGGTKSEAGSQDIDKQSDPGDTKPRGKITNKERARRARQRKKKYYEDLEDRVQHLEKENRLLKIENEQLKTAALWDANSKFAPPKSEQKATVCSMINDTIGMMNKLPSSTKLVEAMQKMEEQYGPYGHEQIKILDNWFQNILENIASSSCKIMLYCMDHESMPKTKEEFDSFIYMKKFEKHEKYPDPIMRQFLESKVEQGLTKEQIQNEVDNVIPIWREIKVELWEGIAKLFETKEQLCKTLMKFDLFKKNLMYKIITKEQFIRNLENFRSFDISISNEQVFGMEKDYIKYEQRMDIPDPKIMAKVQSILMGGDEPISRFITSAFSSTYNMTLLKPMQAV